MKEKLLKFLETYLTGTYHLKIKDKLYLNIPRLAPVFTVAFLVRLIGDTQEIPFVIHIGNVLILVGLFGFFFYNIFPSRRPQKPKEN